MVDLGGEALRLHPAPRLIALSGGWIVAAGLLAVYAAMLRRYAVDFPYADDFAQLLAVPHYVRYAHTLQGKLNEIFSLIPEHRIVTLRLAALFQAHVLGGIDFRGLMYFGSALMIAAGLLLVSTFDRSLRPLAAAVAAALLLSPASYEDTFWTTAALAHFAGAAYAIAALYCLSRAGLGWQLAAAVLALATAFTTAGGLMVFPSAVALLCVQKRWRSAVGWGLCGAVLFAVYFLGYEGFQGSLATYLREPWGLMGFFFTALGAVGREATVALTLGIGLTLFWAWLVLSRRLRSLPAVAVGWIVFLALSFAAIAWGRAGFGFAAALLSRYRVYSEFAVLVTLAALLSQLSRDAGMRLLLIALPVTVALFLASWRYDLPAMEGYSMERRNELDYYVAEGHSLPAPIPPVAFRDFVLMASRDEGYYVATGATPPRHLRAEGITLDTTRPSPAIGVEAPVVGKRVALIRVYAPGYDDGVFLWLKSVDHQYAGTLDQMPRAPLALGFRTGFFRGLYSLEGIAPGRYRIGVAAGERMSMSAAWSDEWLMVE